MKKFLTLIAYFSIAAFATSNALVNAQINFKSINVEVGKQPVAVIPAVKRVNNVWIPNYDTLNIICGGYNEGFKDYFDPETDELPSWWKIEGVKNANPNSPIYKPITVRKIMDFDENWAGYFPYRFDFTAFDPNKNAELHPTVLLIPTKNGIKFFKKSEEEELGYFDDLSGAKSFSLPFDMNVYFVSMRDYDEENSWISTANYVKIFNDESELLDSIPTGYNVQRVIGYTVPFDNWTEEKIFAVLCEKSWGEISTVEFYQTTNDFQQGSTEKVATVEIGKGGNELLLRYIAHNLGGYYPFFFAISDADSKVSIIDGYTLELYKHPNIGMPFFDSNVIQLPEGSSPREMSIKETVDEETGAKNYSAFISTNSNKIFWMPDLRKTSEFIAIETPQISEAILNIWQDNIIAAYTNIYEELWSPPSNIVTILYDGDVSISEVSNSDFIVFPNPIKETVNIFLSQNSEVKGIKILDVLGATVQAISNYNQTENLIQFKLNSKLNSGKYFIQIETSKGFLTQSVVIQ